MHLLTQAYLMKEGVVLFCCFTPFSSPGFFRLPSAGQSWEQGLRLQSLLPRKPWGIRKQRQAAGFLSGDCSPRPVSC